MNINSSNLHAYSTGLLQGKAYRVLTTHLTETLAAFEISIPEWKLLGQLYEHGEMKLAQLAELLGVEPPLVTLLIDQLEKKKLVIKTDHIQDKRAKIIKATEKGMLLISEIEKPVQKKMKYLVKGVSREDIVVYIHVLEVMIKNGS